MSHRPTRTLGLAGLTSIASLLAVGCDQPTSKCNISRGNFAATYTLVSGEGDCAMLRGDVLSVQAYSANSGDSDNRPNYDKTSIAIQPQALTDLLGGAAGLVEANADDLPYALGAFTRPNPVAGYCEVPKLSVGRVRLPEIPEQEVDACTTVPAQPATDVQYVWSNVKVVVSPQNYGTRFDADLEYTVGDCVATYRVAAVYPVVSCNAAPPPEEPAPSDGEPVEGEEPMCPPETVAPEAIPSDDLCGATANIEQGRAYGSGISPDFATRCDPDLLMCVIKQ